MPDFWEFPTVSMGLGPLDAIYQARFNRYLQHRGIKDTSDSRVWCFLGDGEMDEPESLGAIGLAAREELDNLVFVVNCNLQRLDGPVRGNGKIIQELESSFRGAGWNVIKVVWGRQWDDLISQDVDGLLVNKMNTTPDGQFQTYTVESGAYTRESFFGSDPRLLKMVEHLSDDQIRNLPRGGHDYRKVYAAFKSATEHVGQPTVILAHTIKGWTLGEGFEGRNATHQMKKLTKADLKALRDRLYLPIPDSALEGELPPYFHPGEDSDEVQYMKARRAELGGSLPARWSRPSRSSCRPPRSTTSSSAARASRRSPPPWRSSGCSRTWSRTRTSASGSSRSSRTRPAPSASTRCSRAPRSTRRPARRTRRSTASCCCPTRRASRARSCTRASARPAPWRR
jgi:pyruvate dehydrogenase E1 component